MKLVISQPMFFPWVGFFEQIRLCNTYIHYDDVQFSKGSFTNRVQIKTPEGSRWLTVPLKDLRLGQLINEVEIDNKKDWKSEHYALLKHGYSKAEFYDEMICLVEKIYAREWHLINDLSQATLSLICEYYDLSASENFLNVNDMGIVGKGSERVLAICKRLGARTYITGHGASKYLDHKTFEQSLIDVEYMDYKKIPYPQLFGEFNPFVSILDLIANLGKTGKFYISSGTKNWREFIND